MRKVRLILLLFVFLASTLVTSLLPFAEATAQSKTSARVTWESRSPADQVTIYQAYYTLLSCFEHSALKDGNDDRINEINVTLFNWFNEPGTLGGEGTLSFKGENRLASQTTEVLWTKVELRSAVSCWDRKGLENMLKDLGQNTADKASLLCRLGFDRNKKGSPDGAGGGCTFTGSVSADGEGDFYWKDMNRATQVDRYKTVMKNLFWGGKDPYLPPMTEYDRWRVLFSTCAGPYGGTASTGDETILRGTNKAYEIYEVDITTGVRSPEKVFYYADYAEDKKGRIRTDFVMGGGSYARIGGNVLSVLTAYTAPGAVLDTVEALKLARQGALNSGGAPSSYTCEGLEKLLNDKANTYADAVRQIILEGGSVLGTGDADSIGAVTPEDDTSCRIDTWGWILCPLLTTGADLADGAYGFLADSFLVTDVSLVNTDPNAVDAEGNTVGTGTYTAWQIMRNLGNIAFVIVFIIVIFSQLTGLGVSNYGVKKLLPRMVIAAILVNVSFFVCQVAVDLSNIVGYGAKDLLDNVAVQVSNQGGNAAPGEIDEGTGYVVLDESGNLGGIVAALIVGAGVVSWIGIGAVLLAIIGALITLLTVFVILIARKVLIVLLVILSPLAFVAFLLPNTEPLFQKWRKAMTALLMLFPIVGFVYGGSSLVSAILLQTAGEDDPVMQIAAYLALVLPLLVIIPILKASLDGVGKLGGTIQALGQKAKAGGQGAAKRIPERYKNSNYGKFRTKRKEDAMEQVYAGSYTGKNIFRRMRSAGNRNLNQNKAFNAVTGGYGTTRGQKTIRRVRQESVAKQLQYFQADHRDSADIYHETYRSFAATVAAADAKRANGKKLSAKDYDDIRSAEEKLAAASQHIRTNHQAAAPAMMAATQSATDSGFAIGKLQDPTLFKPADYDPVKEWADRLGKP